MEGSPEDRVMRFIRMPRWWHRNATPSMTLIGDECTTRVMRILLPEEEEVRERRNAFKSYFMSFDFDFR